MDDADDVDDADEVDDADDVDDDDVGGADDSTRHVHRAGPSPQRLCTRSPLDYSHPMSIGDETAHETEPLLARLRPRNDVGALITLGFGAVFATGLALVVAARAVNGVAGIGMWLLGEFVLAVSFVQCFVLLHEAGHGTLFTSRRANVVVGHLAGIVTLIPFHAWQPIHQQHHVWAGFQDRDPTTMALVPRPLSVVERTAINVCWRTGIPLFSLLYRVNNFWNLKRLINLLPRRAVQQRLLVSSALTLGAWGAIVVVVGPGAVLRVAGLALLWGFMLVEPIMLSQHSHIPLRLAGDDDVRPFSPARQVPFTRSLRFPRWISRFVLLHFDAHELHHAHPNVPGWRLPALEGSMPTPNTFPAWSWIARARRVPADVLLFSNRDRSGLDL